MNTDSFKGIGLAHVWNQKKYAPSPEVKCLSLSMHKNEYAERSIMGFSVGIVGKPSCGKTSFTNAACMTDFKVGSYPFTTIEANVGVTHVRTPCACADFNVEDNPQNSICIDKVQSVFLSEDLLISW